MSSKKSGFGLLAIFSLIGILGISGGIYVIKKGLIGQKLTPLRGAKVIPDEAILTGFISTDSKNWQQLDNLGLDRTAAFIEQTTRDIEEEFSSFNIDYQKDIHPWLGNIMLAVVPEAEKSTNKNILLVLGVKNKINAYKFLKKIQNNEGNKLEVVKHKGIKINLAKDEREEVTNIAVLGNKVVISDRISTIKQAIDTYKGEPSFASNPENLKALKQSLNLDNNLVKIYLTNYDRILENIFYNPSQPTPETFQPLESVILGIGIEGKQLTMQSYAKLKSNLDLTEAEPFKNKLADKYPEQTIALLNGQGISQFWFDFVNLSEKDNSLKIALQGMRYSTRLVTGLNLDEDILGWMDGEYALGIVKTKQAVIPEIDLKLGTAIILETSDRDTAQKTLDSIENRLQKQGVIIAQSQKINKKTVTKWNVPNSDFDISYTWFDRENLVLTIGNNVIDSMSESTKNSLKESDKFQQFTQKIPNRSLGYFYVDIEEVMVIMKQVPGFYESYDPESIAIFDSIQGIGVTSMMPDLYTTKTDFVVWFK